MLSIVIPTLKPRALDRVLDALARQTNDSFEVIIVENGSADPGLRELVDDFRKLLTVEHLKLPAPGLNKARNCGVSNARHAYIALLDDDCVPVPTWVESIRRAYQQYPGAGVIGGRVRLCFESGAPAWLHGEFRRSLAELDLGEGCRPLGRWEHLVGANLAFTRSVYRQVGGFQNRLGLSGRDHLIRANDEAEFILQASTVGAPGGIYAADMSVEHLIPDNRVDFDYMLDRRFGQGVSDIEQEIFVLGMDAAGQRMASLVIRADWHWNEHATHALKMTEEQALDFTARVFKSRIAYLLGARERFFRSEPECGVLTLTGPRDDSAYRRGRRIGQQYDGAARSGLERLRQILYGRRPCANPFRTVCYLAGVFHDLYQVEPRRIDGLTEMRQ